MKRDSAAEITEPATEQFTSNKDPRSTDRGVICPEPVMIFDQIDTESKRHANLAEAIRGEHAALIHAPDGCTYDLVDLEVLRDLAAAFGFDWFEATVLAASTLTCTTCDNEEQDAATKAIMAYLISGGYSPVRDPGGAGKSYGVSIHIKSDLKNADPVAKLSFGSHTGAMPHITVTGADGQCHAVACLLQETHIALKPTRIDVKVDISMKGLWEALYGNAKEQAKRSKKIKRPVRISGSEGGETFRLGAPSSATCIRVYKKDFERFAKKKIKEEDIDSHLVRIKFQFRPKGLDAIAMAYMTPWQIAQSTPMARAFLEGLGQVLQLGGKCEIIKGRKEISPRTEFDAEASGFHQYKKTFARAACALLFDDVADELVATGHGEAKICALTVERLMVERFAKYVKGSGVARQVLSDFGFSDGVAYDPEERAEGIISLAQNLKLQRYNYRMVALA